MPKLTIPRKLDTDLYNTLLQIAETLDRLEVLIGSEETARNLREGGMALVCEGEGAYLYVRCNGGLFRVAFEPVELVRGRIVIDIGASGGSPEQPPPEQPPPEQPELPEQPPEEPEPPEPPPLEPS